ncbi:MAG: phosphopyruvate hydratase [Candidatus Paceibacterota bacterium]|jgi:enolase
MQIDFLSARQILDTRGRPTIETTISTLDTNSQGRALEATASVPSGKSTGSHEALELRDADGSVATAIANVNGEIARALAGRQFSSLDELDTFLIELDGTPNKSRLGANAILSVSIAAQRLSALLAGIPLWKSIAERAHSAPAAPRLYLNFMNGGAHADFKLPFQEYILVVGGKMGDALPIAHEAFTKLGETLRRLNLPNHEGGLTSATDLPMGDEGGYAPTFEALEEPFEILSNLVAEFPGTSIAIDAAASELYRDGFYTLLGKTYSADELSRLYENLVMQFPLHSIEDPFAEDSASDFAHITSTVGDHVTIIGDDLTVTNPERIKDAIAHKEINSVLIKPNQIGSVKEAIEAVQMTHAAGLKTVASHRSGETDDTFIADFAYGVGAFGIKAGGLGQRERLEKYERLVAIEEEATH